MTNPHLELVPLSDEERAELDRRIAEDEADPRPGVSWAELRRRLESGQDG